MPSEAWSTPLHHFRTTGWLTNTQTNISSLFQRCFNVAFWLIRRRDVGKRQINVETTLWISTVEVTTSNNVESTLYISTLIWTMLDNAETTLPKWLFPNKEKIKNISNAIHVIQSFNNYFTIFFSLIPMLRGICRRILAKLRKFLKDCEKCCIVRTYLNHFTL